MAVSIIRLSTIMVINYKDGVDKLGKDIIKGYRVRKLAPNVADEAVYVVAQKIGTLLKKEVTGYERVNSEKLVSQ